VKAATPNLKKKAALERRSRSRVTSVCRTHKQKNIFWILVQICLRYSQGPEGQWDLCITVFLRRRRKLRK